MFEGDLLEILISYERPFVDFLKILLESDWFPHGYLSLFFAAFLLVIFPVTPLAIARTVVHREALATFQLREFPTIATLMSITIMIDSISDEHPSSFSQIFEKIRENLETFKIIFTFFLVHGMRDEEFDVGPDKSQVEMLHFSFLVKHGQFLVFWGLFTVEMVVSEVFNAAHARMVGHAVTPGQIIFQIHEDA